MRIIYIVFLCTVVFISCSKNEYLNSELQDTFIEFSDSLKYDTISYLTKDTFYLALPIQQFGNSTNNFDTIRISIEGAQLAKNYNYKLQPYYLTNPDKIKDTIFVAFFPNKMFRSEYDISISLESSNTNIKTSINSNSYRVLLHKQSFTGFYTGEYTCFETATNSTYKTEFIQINENTIQNKNFWDFPLEGQTINYTVDELTDSILINETEWYGKLGTLYIISGSGILETNGNFKVNYVMKLTDGTLYQEGIHYYTK